MTNPLDAPLKDLNTLNEAANWLTAQTGKTVTEAHLWNFASKGELPLIVSIPAWQRPGDGELDWREKKTGEKVKVLLSDSMARLSKLGIQRLQSGLPANIELCEIRMENGRILSPQSHIAQHVSVEHIRISRDDLHSLVEQIMTSESIEPFAPAAKVEAVTIATPTRTAPTIEAWRTEARKIGERIYKDKPALNIEQIAAKIQAEMTKRHANKEANMTGRGRRVPSAGSIKRHALTGLKS